MLVFSALSSLSCAFFVDLDIHQYHGHKTKLYFDTVHKLRDIVASTIRITCNCNIEANIYQGSDHGNMKKGYELSIVPLSYRARPKHSSSTTVNIDNPKFLLNLPSLEVTWIPIRVTCFGKSWSLPHELWDHQDGIFMSAFILPSWIFITWTKEQRQKKWYMPNKLKTKIIHADSTMYTMRFSFLLLSTFLISLP